MFETQKDLSEILVEFRNKHNLSLRQLEDKVGLSYSYLSKIERQEVIPPKETVVQLAESMELSQYQMLISAGYIVNLGRDIITGSLDWTENELINQLNTKYKIVAIPALFKLLETRNISTKRFAILMKMDLEAVRDIIQCRKPVSHIQARNFCMVLAVYFYEIFRIRKVNYDVKFLGANKDEDVAYVVYKFIENYRISTIHSVRETAATIHYESVTEDFVKIPIYGEIKAGYGMIGEENIIGYEMAAKSKVSDGEHFYLLVKGDSMIDAGIHDGALILIRRQNTVKEGKIGVCIIGEEATLKRVFYDGDKVILQAENRNIKPKTYDISEVIFQGQAVSVVTEL